jgi:hypothetical protein
MTTCSNCETEALFEYVVTASTKIPFCRKHIPGFLKSVPYSVRLVKIEKSATVEAPKASKKKTVVEEPLVVEEVVGDTPSEEPTPEVTEAE